MTKAQQDKRARRKKRTKRHNRIPAFVIRAVRSDKERRTYGR